jgi:hypothetical protein
MHFRTALATILTFFLIFSSLIAQDDPDRQRAYLEEIINLQEKPEHFDEYVNYHDETWLDWVERTGALPPDFESVPSLPFLPDPLIIDEGGETFRLKRKSNGSSSGNGSKNR